VQSEPSGQAEHSPPQSVSTSSPFVIPSLQLGVSAAQAAPSQASTGGANGVTQPGSSEFAAHPGSLAGDSAGGDSAGGDSAGGDSAGSGCGTSEGASNGEGSKPSSVNVQAAESCRNAASEAATMARRHMFVLA
jgi:hypothetical protein